MIPPPPRSELIARLGVESEPPRLDEALTHASFVNENPGCSDYERLEFLGDAVLGLCVSELLTERFPRASVGKLTRMRAAIVSTESLASFARAHDLARFVRFGRGTRTSGDATRDKVMADVVEAIVAAVFLHAGLDAARRLAATIVGHRIDAASLIAERDPKSKLQEIVQRDGGEVPLYRTVRVEGPDHDRAFEVEVIVAGQPAGRGRGRSKKQAEQEAARDALGRLLSPEENVP